MSTQTKQETVIDYSAVATVTLTMYLNVEHQIITPYRVGHSDIDLLLKNEARGDAMEVVTDLLWWGKQHKLPLMSLEFEGVNEIEVSRLDVR